MKFLLTEILAEENKEVQELIPRIKHSYDTENAEEFVAIGKEIFNAVLENHEDMNQEAFLTNIEKVVDELEDMQAMAFTQLLVSQREDKINGFQLNDILGESDKIFKRLKAVSIKIEEEKIEEGLKIKKGEAFYRKAMA